MNKFSKNVLSKYVSGAMMFSLMPIPLLSNLFSFGPTINSVQTPLVVQPSTMEPASASSSSSVLGIFFGDLPDSQVQAIVTKQKDYVSSRKAYPAALSVIQKYEDTIRTVADEKGVPEDVALGVATLENGGSATAVSPAGAAGIFQLMRGTAKSLGLTVNKSVDERMNPQMNIEAGVSYLAQNYGLFGDWGLSTWAYHAGEGNVIKALKIYAENNGGTNLVGIKDPEQLKNYIAQNGITVYKLLSDPAVQNFAKKLNDDSANYAYKVVASASLLAEAN